MILVTDRDTCIEARFFRNNYFSLSGLGETKEEALRALRTEIEAYMIADEQSIERMATAIDDIDRALDA